VIEYNTYASLTLASRVVYIPWWVHILTIIEWRVNAYYSIVHSGGEITVAHGYSLDFVPVINLHLVTFKVQLY
jgi:hypothetical protein